MSTARVREALSWLERRGSARIRKEMLSRYGIATPRAYGVSVAGIRQLGKQLGRDHALAGELWATGWYEARMLAAFVAEPGRLTVAQMNRWTGDFDNWAICDTLCFHLYDRTPLAWGRLAPWSARTDEFVRRAAFALLASLALHDRETPDAKFLPTLRLIERAAADDRNFVKKGVSWALRSVGARSPALRAAGLELAERLAAGDAPGARWIGKDALRDLQRPAVRDRARRRDARR